MKLYRPFALAVLALVALALGQSPAAAQYSGQRVPLGILITNWDCAPCAPVNQALDAYIPTMGNDVALIRVHCWWPGPDDPIYLANVDQSQFLIYGTPSGPDYAPHMWMDNIVNVGSGAAAMVPAYTARLEVPSPLEIAIDFDTGTHTTQLSVDVLDSMPLGQYRLYVAATEDHVFAPGTNGEDYHNQAFRRLYPDTDGIPVATALGVQEFSVATPLNDRWVFENVRLTAYVQSVDTGEIQNAATMFASEGGVLAAPGEVAAARLRVDAYPNPFNPMTRVHFDLPRAGEVVVQVHDLSGRVVRTLVDGHRDAGRHEVAWHGRDDAGRPVASGMYLARVRSQDGVASGKLVLAK
jgi:hypothetical protein